jgi:hypothetical protein
VEAVKEQWATGAYRSSDHIIEAQLNSAAQANVETLQRMIVAIENIQAQEEKTNG